MRIRNPSCMTTFPVLSTHPSSVQGFYKTGLRTDVVQHALLLPVLVNHVRLHLSLNFLGKFSVFLLFLSSFMFHLASGFLKL
jgi:hypothetical protein